MTTTQDTADQIAEEMEKAFFWSDDDHENHVVPSNEMVSAIIRKHTAPLEEALRVYAECGDGCTCGDGWGHGPAREALKKC